MQRQIRRKHWKPRLNELCVCGSGEVYKNCCWGNLPGFDIGKAYSAACKRERYGLALVAARADVTQYTIWHKTNTAPFIQNWEPIEKLLRIDVNALNEYIDRLSWLYFNTGRWKNWPAALDRLSANIQHAWWVKKITYHRALFHLAPGGNRSEARLELAKLGPITIAEDDIDVLQIFIDLELSKASFSERAAFFDRILEIDGSAESQIQYRGGKAVNLLLYGDRKAAEALLVSILNDYKGSEDYSSLSFYGRHKLLEVQQTFGAITGDKDLLRQTASQLSAVMQKEIWTAAGRSRLHREIGDCYRYAQEWELAASAYTEATSLGKSIISRVHLAECLLYQNNIESAAQEIQSVPINALDKHEMMDFVFTFSAISIWSENLKMLGEAKDLLTQMESAEPLFNERRLNLLVRVTETASQGAATPVAKADSTPESGVAGAARVFLLQPNFFGIGINFNEIIERFSRPGKKKTLAIEHQATQGTKQ